MRPSEDIIKRFSPASEIVGKQIENVILDFQEWFGTEIPNTPEEQRAVDVAFAGWIGGMCSVVQPGSNFNRKYKASP